MNYNLTSGSADKLMLRQSKMAVVVMILKRNAVRSQTAISSTTVAIYTRIILSTTDSVPLIMIVKSNHPSHRSNFV